MYYNYLNNVFLSNSIDSLYPFFLNVLLWNNGILNYEVKISLNSVTKNTSYINWKDKSMLTDDFGFILKWVNWYIKKDMNDLVLNVNDKNREKIKSYQMDYLLILQNLISIYVIIFQDIVNFISREEEFKNLLSILKLRNFVFSNYENIHTYNLLIIHVATANRFVLSMLFFNNYFVNLLINKDSINFLKEVILYVYQQLNYIENFIKCNVNKLKHDINLWIYTWQASYRLLVISFIVSEIITTTKKDNNISMYNDIFFDKILNIFKSLIYNYIYGWWLERNFFTELFIKNSFLYVDNNEILKNMSLDIKNNHWLNKFKKEIAYFMNSYSIDYSNLLVDYNLSIKVKKIINSFSVK